MPGDLNEISKKELLEFTGISYGQLYRWKRKGLIPEAWFVKRAAFTGQETFFPRTEILDRVERIQGLKEEINLDQVAAQAGLSKFHFHRLYKSATGVSPARYHVNLRMNAARRLLRETKGSVVAVALEVGYTNPSHFAQLFRKETGLSPSDYRKKI